MGERDYRKLIERVFGRGASKSFKTYESNVNMISYHLASGDVSTNYGMSNTRIMALIDTGYILGMGPIKFLRSAREQVIKRLCDEFSLIYHRSYESDFETLFNKQSDVAVLIEEDTVIMFAKTDEAMSKVAEVIREFIVGGKSTVTYFYEDCGDLESDQIQINQGEPELIIPELYPTIDIKLLCKEFSASHEKILILHGEPGVGKTTFIKYLINEGFYNKIAYVKDMALFKSGQLWHSLTRQEYDLIIFDDIDDILQSRKDNKEANFIGSLLSYTDGVIKRRTKIIITTNQEIREIDPAITRPGRSFDFIVLPALSNEQARSLWVDTLKQDGSDFERRFGTSNVTQASLMSEYLRITLVKSERSYMKVGPSNYSVQQKLETLGIASGSVKTGFGR